MTAVADPSEIAAGASSQLVATGAEDYLWSPGKTLDDSTNISNPVATPLQTTTYTVIGTTTQFTDASGTTDGCTSEVQVTITVEGILGFPVAFSPNGDGQNEIWDIQAQSNPDCMLSIFDGRGRRIFEGQGENWDGTYDGKSVPEGTYYFVYGCPDRKPLTGSVLLFR
jgi:gliding motility-associated-like protein